LDSATPFVLAKSVDEEESEEHETAEDDHVGSRAALYEHEDALTHAERVEHLQRA